MGKPAMELGRDMVDFLADLVSGGGRYRGTWFGWRPGSSEKTRIGQFSAEGRKSFASAGGIARFPP